jgi:hypothetical protein
MAGTGGHGVIQRELGLAAFHDADSTCLVDVHAAVLVDSPGDHPATLPGRVAVVGHCSAPDLVPVIANH